MSHGTRMLVLRIGYRSETRCCTTRPHQPEVARSPLVRLKSTVYELCQGWKKRKSTWHHVHWHCDSQCDICVTDRNGKSKLWVLYEQRRGCQSVGIFRVMRRTMRVARYLWDINTSHYNHHNHKLPLAQMLPSLATWILLICPRSLPLLVERSKDRGHQYHDATKIRKLRKSSESLKSSNLLNQASLDHLAISMLAGSLQSWPVSCVWSNPCWPSGFFYFGHKIQANS